MKFGQCRSSSWAASLCEATLYPGGGTASLCKCNGISYHARRPSPEPEQRYRDSVLWRRPARASRCVTAGKTIVVAVQALDQGKVPMVDGSGLHGILADTRAPAETAVDSPAAAVGVTPWVGSSGGGLAVVGTF